MLHAKAIFRSTPLFENSSCLNPFIRIRNSIIHQLKTRPNFNLARAQRNFSFWILCYLNRRIRNVWSLVWTKKQQHLTHRTHAKDTGFLWLWVSDRSFRDKYRKNYSHKANSSLLIKSFSAAPYKARDAARSFFLVKSVLIIQTTPTRSFWINSAKKLSLVL